MKILIDTKHTISNLFYILRKIYTVDERRELLLGMCTLFEVVEIGKSKIISALDNKKFEDFEDCLQMQCALGCEADFIVTRNLKDFSASLVKCIELAEFIKKYLQR